MDIQVADDWKDFELLDAGGGERFERWGRIHVIRPDPQVLWPADKSTQTQWRGRAHAHYHRSAKGGGSWEALRDMPESWTLVHRNLTFAIRPTGFKHMGLFPEQAVNWNWMADLIGAAGRPVKALNLFAYTGGATLACAAAGAEVCHLDAVKSMVHWARDNAGHSGLAGKPIRWIIDDAFKFVTRELRRHAQYDAVIMDPPSYGRGTGGETWKIEDMLYNLVEQCARLLSDKPLFFLVNSYTTGLSPTVLRNILSLALQERGGTVSAGEVGLPVTARGLVLPCGIFGRWQSGESR